MQVIVDDLLVNYESTGKGRVVVLLHGWVDSLSTFRQLQVDLSRRYRVLSLDLPGFGQTQAPGSVWGLGDYTQFVQRFLHKLQVKEVYAIVGHSNGGAVAIKGLANGSLQAEKLVLLAPAGIRTTERGRKLVFKMIAKTGKVATFWLPLSQKRRLQQALYGAAGSDMLIAPHLQETFKKTVGEDLQPDAARLQVPTLLIYGEQDHDTPPVFGELYHNLINASTLQILPGASHFVHHDQPEKVNHLVLDFLQ